MNKQQESRLEYIKNILSQINKNKYLNKNLIFKWWTSLMLFYGLDRFSEDLDFNYIEDDTIDVIEGIFIGLWYTYIKEVMEFWTRFQVEYLVWNDKFHCIVDLSKYLYKTEPDIDIKNFAWNPLKILKLEQNFAHKFCAFYERKKWRDVVDINFYMKKWLFPDEKILKERHKKNFKDFLLILIKELQTPYLNERLTKALDQLHYNNYSLYEYKNNIIENISNSYTWWIFKFDINYKEKINDSVKIIVLDENSTLLIDWQVINNKIQTKYGIVDSKSVKLIYGCETKEKLFWYINNVFLEKKLILKPSVVNKIKLIN